MKHVNKLIANKVLNYSISGSGSSSIQYPNYANNFQEVLEVLKSIDIEEWSVHFVGTKYQATISYKIKLPGKRPGEVEEKLSYITKWATTPSLAMCGAILDRYGVKYE